MCRRETDRRMFPSKGLDQHLAAVWTTACPAGDLGQQLKGAFGGPEIRNVQADVGIDDADKGDIGKIEPLGDHLRTEKDVNKPAAKGTEHPGMAAALLHAVAIHAPHDKAGELLLNFRLQFFRAESLVANRPLAAGRARPRKL